MGADNGWDKMRREHADRVTVLTHERDTARAEVARLKAEVAAQVLRAEEAERKVAGFERFVPDLNEARTRAAALARRVEESTPDDLRAAGWSVGIHNDYRLNGEAHTFWLLTHPSGRWIKGEGRTDAEALAQARAALSAPAAEGPHEG